MIDGPWFIPEIRGCQVAGMKCMRQDVRSEGSGDQAHLRPCKDLELLSQGMQEAIAAF